MPKRDEILKNLTKPNGYGVLLMGQMSGAPETLEFVINMGEIDDKMNAYREKSSYIIRALGVADHRISLGLFGKLEFVEDHPLLYEHNQASGALFFRTSQEKQTNELMLDFLQAYASTFRGWKQIPEYLNTNQPLYDLLNSNGDHVGNMPESLAVNLSKVFEKHGCETKILKEEVPVDQDEHGRSQKYKALIIDETSYVVALEFTVDSFGK